MPNSFANHPLHAEHQDHLLSSLVFLSKYYGKPFSKQALSSGLPLVNGTLTPQLFPRAAARAGISAKLVKKSLDSIPNPLLPCVLLLNDNRVAILLSINEDEAKISWADIPDSEHHIELTELAELYSGYSFLVKQKYRFDERSQQVLKTKSGHWFWSTLNISSGIYRDALIAAFFINLFAVASPLFVMNVYDRVVPNLAMDTLWVLSIGIFVVMIFDFILKEIRAHLLDLAAKKSDILLSSKLFEKVLNINMAARPKSIGAFARNIQDFESIRDFITSATIAAFIDIPFSILFIVVIALVAGPLALVPVTAIVIMLGYSWWVKGKIKHEVEVGSRYSVEKNAHLIETLSGIETLKLANAESQFQHKWEKVVANIAQWNLSVKKLSTSVSSVTGFVMQIATIMIVIVGVYLITDGEMSLGALIAGVMLTGRALAPFSQMAILATRYNQAEIALKSLDEVMSLPEESLDQYLHRPYLEGQVSFKNVSFAYPQVEHNVLTGINLEIKPKEKVAIIGRIGAGKSTLEKLLLGFYKPSEGALRLDGIDINQLSPVDIRQKVGCLPQEINLFYGSIRDNITLGVPHIDEELVVRAAKLAGVTYFTDKDPDGLDRQVGERGAYLSGGQRQAVALARALLFNPPIMILDEPTSHMDSQSENHICNALGDIVADKTLVLITHKMSMVSLVDRIVVMDQGRVIADGSKAFILDALKSGKIKAQI
ncbi:type I secretion system permease/ATPase [Catenovulum sp. SM1970]|uniref:type I secretion system permease/ATPase n=1 Tax=Marinifaba aquimaris TaxID=2741323 RepID=UPI001572D1EF|nr:type I secretion system permease/ATPase [Marinifaba aquimaris]NTS75632.1 type I secretion system permease/ATPase [Marinifaba aquimaris]